MVCVASALEDLSCWRDDEGSLACAKRLVSVGAE